MLRYKHPDDFGETTSAFSICSFWWVEALAMMGEVDEAVALFRRLEKYANPLGLFSEDIDPETGALLGNFPQAYTHVGLIHAAITIGEILDARTAPSAPGPDRSHVRATEARKHGAIFKCQCRLAALAFQDLLRGSVLPWTSFVTPFVPVATLLSWDVHEIDWLLLAAQLAASAATAQPLAGSAAAIRTYDGRSGSLDVEPPRIDQSIEIDGNLDEAVWSQAAVLAGFSRYAPVDGAPADNPTDVLVWYSPTAMHFGIRASAPAGIVRATLADRDHIQSDDHVIIFLSTYNDGRQALVFGVNPLGVQLDGALAEGTRGTGGGFTGLSTGRETPDLSPDFVFQSKGRVTDAATKSRSAFRSRASAISRSRNRTGAFTSRASCRSRASKTAGRRRKRERSVVPVAVGPSEEPHRPAPRARARSESDRHHQARRAADRRGGWSYDASRPEFGMNLRWGITPNLTMNGTVNPGLLAGRIRRRPVQFRSAPGAVLSGEAAVLPRRHRTVLRRRTT